MLNLLSESSTVSDYYTQYLDTILKYQNFKRNSIFIRYLNVNGDVSVYEEADETSFDRYKSGVTFDVYDNTPAFLINQSINNSVDRSDINGVRLDGEISIVIYTIDAPRIHDLVIFPYSPLKEDEIFRVKALSVAYSNVDKIKYFTLQLEYAPTNNITDLNIGNLYAYSLILEQNIYQTKYKRIREESIILNKYLELLKFDEKSELYYFEENEYKIAPFEINKKIYDFLAYNENYKQYFTNIKQPFGILENINTLYLNPINDFKIKKPESIEIFNSLDNFIFSRLDNLKIIPGICSVISFPTVIPQLTSYLYNTITQYSKIVNPNYIYTNDLLFDIPELIDIFQR
jgi:hypothetical protein